MIDRQHDVILFQCDGCAAVLDTETENFDTARNILRRKQWQPRKSGDDWQHFCPKCKGGAA